MTEHSIQSNTCWSPCPLTMGFSCCHCRHTCRTSQVAATLRAAALCVRGCQCWGFSVLLPWCSNYCSQSAAPTHLTSSRAPITDSLRLELTCCSTHSCDQDESKLQWCRALVGSRSLLLTSTALVASTLLLLGARPSRRRCGCERFQ